MLSVTFDYLNNFEYSEDDKKEILGAADVLLSDNESKEFLENFINSYKNDKHSVSFKELEAKAKHSAEKNGVNEYTARLIFYISLTPYALSYYIEAGLSDIEWYDSMIDLKWKCNECRTRYGVAGVFSKYDWFGRFFTTERVAFGRLQYNMTKSKKAYKSEHFDINEEAPLLSVHIPSDTRSPLSRENRLESYRRAAEFFKKDFPTGEVIFCCHSWLLSPLNLKLLSQGSNIFSFISDFELDLSSEEDSIGDIWRIFPIAEYDGDPTSLSETTSLMRLYKNHLVNGGTITAAAGYMHAKTIR